MRSGDWKELAPDSVELAQMASEWASAYIHIPFCRRVCPYCDFNVVEGREDVAERYLAGLIREIESEPEWRTLDAVFVGGGTPSRLPPSALGSVLEALGRRFGLSGDAEVTLEANPEDWSLDYARDLIAVGFTRVSFGVQSFDSDVLGYLGRLHTPSQASEAVTAAREAGFSSISIDLIFGSRGEDLGSWRFSLETAIALDPHHVSTYALTVERGTELSRRVGAGEPPPDPDLQADQWELADALLGEAGMIRYEVSNAAVQGHPCRYNLSVWAQGEYLGFGAGAHGFRDGVRRRNVRRLDAYLQRTESGIGAVQGTEAIEGWAREQERLMLGLRRSAGAVLGPGGEALLESASGKRLLRAGVIAVGGDRLVVVRPLLTDEVVRAVLDLPPPSNIGVS